MCTLALFFNLLDAYPLLVAANRDERYDRPTMAPDLISSRPKIFAGKDLLVGGTWLGVNEFGLVVGILNRRADGIRRVAPKPRSRGLLCLDLLTLKTAREADDYIRRSEEEYNPFTVVYADTAHAGVAFNNGGNITTDSLNVGLHVFSSAAATDTRSGKADRAYGRFLQWAHESPPENHRGDWLDKLHLLLGDHTTLVADDPRDAICVHGLESGTVSSSVVRLSARERRFETYYCAGTPCENDFGRPLPLELS